MAAAPEIEGCTAPRGMGIGYDAVELVDWTSFRKHGSELLKRSKDPLRCLGRMRERAREFLGHDFGRLQKVSIVNKIVLMTDKVGILPYQGEERTQDFISMKGEQNCEVKERPCIIFQGSVLAFSGDLAAASTEGAQTRKNWVIDGPVEADVMTLLLDGDNLPVPMDDDFGRSFRIEAQFNSVRDVLEVNLGENDEVASVCAHVQGPIHMCANVGLGIHLIKEQSCSDHVRLNFNPFEKPTELKRNYAAKFTNKEICTVRFDYGVSVEEDPDPGGSWVLGNHSVHLKEEAGSTDPRNMSFLQYACYTGIKKHLFLPVGTAVYIVDLSDGRHTSFEDDRREQ
ncbi:hypothetical protein TRIUR3_05014 [Triticum urartu]|uniref:Uncharacterized protein n=1 Tax=Triticum urartu TaxID=4572 RepID=M7Z2T5_TRIUA|nr:hypothetical protein TRIUR3_05014 [Triticum urartu]